MFKGQAIAKFIGTNKNFRAWLAAGMPEKVVNMAEYRKKKKTANKRPASKENNVISFILPKGTA